jgi:hypothetical protein
MSTKMMASTFADYEDTADYAKANIQNAVKYGIVSGDQHNMLNPKNEATRAETAKIIYYIYINAI